MNLKVFLQKKKKQNEPQSQKKEDKILEIRVN